MTDKQDPIAHAARLLREAAEELRQSYTLSSDRNNWIGEPDAKAAYDDHLAAAQALEDWEQAIGAGGVEPLCKQVAPQTQAAPDERAAFEKWLRVKPCGAAHDFGWEAWRARAALAATRIAELESELEAVGAGGVSGPLMGIAAPPTAQAEGWTKLPGQLPEPGMPVLLDIGKKYPIRALWAEKHTVRVGTDVDDWGEYDEETDEYYCPEGWYEWNEHEEVHWAVSETPRAWMPIPPTSAEGVEHG